jgi:hypothetical protein
MATKEAQFSAERWANPKLWLPIESSQIGRLPKEAYIQNLFSDLPPRDSKIVELWGSRVYWTHRLIRLYMEYCSFGTVADLLRAYANADTMEQYATVGYVRGRLTLKMTFD